MAKRSEPPVPQLPADVDAPFHLTCKLCSNALHEPVRVRATAPRLVPIVACLQVMFGPCGHSSCRQCMVQMVSVALIQLSQRDPLKARPDAPARGAVGAADENEKVG